MLFTKNGTTGGGFRKDSSGLNFGCFEIAEPVLAPSQKWLFKFKLIKAKLKREFLSWNSYILHTQYHIWLVAAVLDSTDKNTMGLCWSGLEKKICYPDFHSNLLFACISSWLLAVCT